MYRKSFFRASIIIGLAVVVSRVLGLVREQYTLYLFGAGWDLDAYISAYKVPTLLRNLLGEGAFSAVFVSIFSGLYHFNKKKAQQFTNQVLSYLMVISIAISFIMLYFTPCYMSLLHKSSANFLLAVRLSQIMVFFVNFISLAAIFMGILNSANKYFIPAFAPAIGNIANILIIVLFHKYWGVYTLAVAYLANAFILMIVQIPFIYKMGFRFSFNFKLTPRVKFFFWSFFPVAFGMAFFQINQLLSNSFSSRIEGGNTIIDKSFLIIQMAIAILSAGISTAILPILSKERYLHQKAQVYFDSVKSIFLVVFPFTIIFMVLSQDISSFVYKDVLNFFGVGLGKINEVTITKIGVIIGLFAPGITIYSLVVMATRAFQGMKKYSYPVIGSAISTIVNLIIMSVYFKKYGINILPISINIASCCDLLILVILLRKFTKIQNSHTFLQFFIKNAFSGVFMFFVVYGTRNMLHNIENIARLPFLCFLGIIAYFFAMCIVKEENALLLYNSVSQRIKRMLKIKSKE